MLYCVPAVCLTEARSQTTGGQRDHHADDQYSSARETCGMIYGWHRRLQLILLKIQLLFTALMGLQVDFDKLAAYFSGLLSAIDRGYNGVERIVVAWLDQTRKLARAAMTGTHSMLQHRSFCDRTDRIERSLRRLRELKESVHEKFEQILSRYERSDLRRWLSNKLNCSDKTNRYVSVDATPRCHTVSQQGFGNTYNMYLIICH